MKVVFYYKIEKEPDKEKQKNLVEALLKYIQDKKTQKLKINKLELEKKLKYISNSTIVESKGKKITVKVDFDNRKARFLILKDEEKIQVFDRKDPEYKKRLNQNPYVQTKKDGFITNVIYLNQKTRDYLEKSRDEIKKELEQLESQKKVKKEKVKKIKDTKRYDKVNERIEEVVDDILQQASRGHHTQQEILADIESFIDPKLLGNAKMFIPAIKKRVKEALEWKNYDEDQESKRETTKAELENALADLESFFDDMALQEKLKNPTKSKQKPKIYVNKEKLEKIKATIKKLKNPTLTKRQKALKLFKDFNHYDPKKIAQINIPISATTYFLKLGEVDNLEYISDKAIFESDQKTLRRKVRTYIHNFSEHNKAPLLLTNPEGNILIIYDPKNKIEVKKEGII